jgi:hypothetical protein
VSFEVAAKGPQDRARNHQLFVRANDANRGPAGVSGNHPRSLRIARLIQFNAEEAQPLTDARADEWRIFADASCEDKRVQSTEHCGERADPLLRLITKQRHRLRRPRVTRFAREQSRRSELVPDTPSSPDSWFTICWNRTAVMGSVRAR